MKGSRLFKKAFIFLAATIIGSGTLMFSQNRSVERKVKPAFKEYFGLPRASIFLHLNKSVHVKGEEIWFKGYVYNRLKSTVINEPLNLYVGIYDAKGNQMKKELFISKNGISQGQMTIDSTFSEGLYYIKATTSGMRNFKEDDSYVQQFTVLEGAETIVEKDKAHIDLQFLPEGGHLIDGVPATVGVKVLNQLGKGVQNLSGYLVKVTGDTVAGFKTNKFGLAKFNLLPKKEESYESNFVAIEGHKARFLLPEVEEKGIGMTIKRLPRNRLLISLGTNGLTRNEIGNRTYALLFHRDGLLKQIDVAFPSNESFVSYVLEANELHPMMNIVTLVDGEGNPLAERLVFNSYGFELGELNTSLRLVKDDSIQLTLFKKKKSDSLQFLSASILPSGTLAYQHKKNILSTFLLSPYVKGYIEKPSYYFKEMSIEKENELDLLLLTQGWSRYNWNNLYSNPPQQKYDFRSGVDIYGKLNSQLGRKNNLLIYPENKPNPRVIEFKRASNEFLLEDYYLEKGDELQFTVVGVNGKMSKPSLYLTLDDGVTTDKIYDTRRDDLELSVHENSVRFNMDNFITPSETIALDEAVVLGTNKDKYPTSPLVSDNRITKVTKPIKNMYPLVMDIIRSNGYKVYIQPNAGYNRISVTSMRNRVSPAFYIDDVYQADFNMLEDILTEEVESYFIDRSGNGEGAAGGGVIRLYRKKYGDDDSFRLTKHPKFFKHIVNQGFSPIKEFYVPNYSKINDNAFINFGAIHWEPNIIVDKDGKATFIFKGNGLKEFQIFVEGMGKDGTLFSTAKTIRLDSSQ